MIGSSGEPIGLLTVCLLLQQAECEWGGLWQTREQPKQNKSKSNYPKTQSWGRTALPNSPAIAAAQIPLSLNWPGVAHQQSPQLCNRVGSTTH
jgi:hypothetical protein